MNIIGVIPARYNSTRFPGKPLADICGRPMLYWVHQRASQVPEFSSVLVATDDERIASMCEKNNMKFCMTSDTAPNHIHRIWEVSEKIEADYYVSVNGDEPLIDPECIRRILPAKAEQTVPCFYGAYRDMTDPAEVIDTSNVKIVLDKENRCLYQSRLPIPSTKGSLLFKYKKAIGIECFNKKALDLFAKADMGTLERIEDIDHLRFIENGIPLRYTQVESESISVDTKTDLEKVRLIMERQLSE